MSADVTIAGASYTDVPAVELPKTGGGTVTFTDVSSTTATAADVKAPKVFYNANGTLTVGTGAEGMVLLSYGHSTWNDFLTAYQANNIVYCRAATGNNPASGQQLRLAFMAYIGTSAETPTSVEFQYYRSVSSHSDSQQGDQVYVYTLSNKGVWSVTVREAYTKIVAGTGLKSSYSNGVLTISLDS